MPWLSRQKHSVWGLLVSLTRGKSSWNIKYTVECQPPSSYNTSLNHLGRYMLFITIHASQPSTEPQYKKHSQQPYTQFIAASLASFPAFRAQVVNFLYVFATIISIHGGTPFADSVLLTASWITDTSSSAPSTRVRSMGPQSRGQDANLRSALLSNNMLRLFIVTLQLGFIYVPCRCWSNDRERGQGFSWMLVEALFHLHYGGRELLSHLV